MSTAKQIEAMFVYDDLMYVEIDLESDQEYPDPEREDTVVLPHKAFENTGSDGSYRSIALDRIKASNKKWVYLEYRDGEGSGIPFVELIRVIRENPGLKTAVFDEAFSDGTCIIYPSGKKNFPVDATGKTPTNLLIERETLLELAGEFLSLFPFPLQKLVRAAAEKEIPVLSLHNCHRRLQSIRPEMLLPGISHNGRENKRILVVSHEFSRTGAPLVLAEACVSILNKHGYDLLVISPKDGPVREIYQNNGIPVMIVKNLLEWNCTFLYRFAQLFDLVIVNTTTPHVSVNILNNMCIPTFWWIHECDEGYQWVEDCLPQTLGENIHVFCVGEYAKRVLLKHFPAYQTKILLYGLSDVNPQKTVYPFKEDEKRDFLCVGSIENRKGQDILAEAIGLLDEETRSRCRFRIIGSVNDERVFEKVKQAEEAYPDTVEYVPNIPREELFGYYRDMYCVICASRDDPMPTFVTEAMMIGKPAICSENTGTASLLDDGVNGFLYFNDDPRQLAGCIRKMLALSTEQWQAFGFAARNCYDAYFNLARFEELFLQAIGESEEDSASSGNKKDHTYRVSVLDECLEMTIGSDSGQTGTTEEELWNRYYEARQEVEKLTAEKDRIYQELLAHSVALSAVYNSNSWRITAPLRKISALFKGQ